MILSTDSDKIIKIEAAYNMKYLCQELDETFIKRNLLKTIEAYINDEDTKIKTEAFLAIIWNFKKFQEEPIGNFFNNFIQKLNMFFDNSYEFDLLYQIFSSIVAEYFDKLHVYNSNNKNFYNLVKTFLKVNTINLIKL